jgi:pyruvate/2-oxoglutarate dehydrogenase complex dihydrolipoamide acyltransferase (E2) component
MAAPNDTFKTVPFPPMRRLMIDAGRHWRKASIVYGLTEFDVTPVRARMRAHKEKTGETLSLTAYVAVCLGRAVAADRSVHAYRNWRDQLIIFDDVDISMMMEVQTQHGSYAIIHVIRAADKKTFREIHDEIRSVQSGRSRAAGLGGSRIVKSFVRLPTFLREIIYWFFTHNPGMWKKQGGTVGLTTLGMFGKGGGWGLPLTNSNLAVCIGGIAERPAYVGDELARREFLAVTVAFNHDIIDGGPAARFVYLLKDLMESGDLLDDAPAG